MILLAFLSPCALVRWRDLRCHSKKEKRWDTLQISKLQFYLWLLKIYQQVCEIKPTGIHRRAALPLCGPKFHGSNKFSFIFCVNLLARLKWEIIKIRWWYQVCVYYVIERLQFYHPAEIHMNTILACPLYKKKINKIVIFENILNFELYVKIRLTCPVIVFLFFCSSLIFLTSSFLLDRQAAGTKHKEV